MERVNQFESRAISGKRVLFLNWRDPWHPLAGGAESYCWNVATRFAAGGADVTFFTAHPARLSATESRAGIRIVRRGGTYTVYLWAALFMLLSGHRFDAIIDSQNGVPFFAPLFVAWRRCQVLLLIHHVHQDQFAWRFGEPLAALGRWLEGPASRWVYRSCAIVAVSPTTRTEVRRRLRLRGPIYMVPNGINPPADAVHPRAPVPTVVYVGRLVPQKRLELLLKAAAEVRKNIPELHLEVVGDGPERQRLERLATRLELNGVVRFHGWVSEEMRWAQLANGWLMATPSSGEGWGLTVIEANAVGRPALAFRVPGLVNSIVEGLNGWLVDGRDSFGAVLESRLLELGSEVHATDIAASCRAWSERFSWDRSAARIAAIVSGAVPLTGGTARSGAGIAVSDVATVVELEASSGLERLLDRLPPNDLWALSGPTVRILFPGRDGEAAIMELEAAGVSGRARTRVALTSELLFGLREAL